MFWMCPAAGARSLTTWEAGVGHGVSRARRPGGLGKWWEGQRGVGCIPRGCRCPPCWASGLASGAPCPPSLGADAGQVGVAGPP